MATESAKVSLYYTNGRSNLNISVGKWPILIKFYVQHHCDGERLHKHLEQIQSKLVSMEAESAH